MISKARSLVSCSAVCLLVVPALFAQKYIPKQITFSGYSAASQQALLAASGLKAGIAVGQPEIQAAAQKLSDTGLFSDIRFSFNGVELHYTLKPADGALPAAYENFPGWTSTQLNAAVAAQVPLFNGSVIPESGLQTQVIEALTTLLQQKGIAAKVVGMSENDLSGKPSGVSFRVVTPPVQIGAVTLNGVGPDWAAPVAAIGKAAAGQEYGSAAELALQEAVKAVYHRQGYLDVELANFAYGSPQFVDGKVAVPVSAMIQQGPQYRVSGVHLSGDALMTQEEFAKQAKIHFGEIANEDLLRATLANVARPYKAKGYLRAKVSANPVFDRTRRTVDYSITVTPGAVFHMGKLTLVNLDPENQALVMKYWTLQSGDIYDATYPPTFLNLNKATLHALDGWSAEYKESANLDTHIMDLVITFRPGGPVN